MQSHAIIELEEGSLNVVVGVRDGSKTRVVRSIRLQCPDLGRESLSNALRSIGRDMLEGAPGVHVVLGERRVQHFLSTVPKMGAADVVGFVVREALRLTGLPSLGEALVATRLLRTLPGGKLVMGTTAIGRSVWEPIKDAFAANNLQVLSLHSMEACTALAAVSSDGRATAMVELNAGRARFVLCDGQTPVQVRRFLIGGGGEANEGALATQLAMELPRTFDWLRETGQPIPSTLILGLRVSIDEDAISMLRSDELQEIVRAACPVELAPEQAMPGIGTAMLLTRVCHVQTLPSLLDAPRLQLPWSSSRWLGLAAASVAGLACSWSAVVDGTSFFAARSDKTVAVAEADRLQSELAMVGGPEVAAVVTADGAWLDKALSMRRPVSRLLADISNSAGPELHLEKLKFASTERIVVTGVVRGDSRKTALAAIAAFSRRLGALSYLKLGGEDEISEVAQQKNCFRFKLGMTWRNS
jgi:hypothetical protein